MRRGEAIVHLRFAVTRRHNDDDRRRPREFRAHAASGATRMSVVVAADRCDGNGVHLAGNGRVRGEYSRIDAGRKAAPAKYPITREAGSPRRCNYL